MHITLKDKNKNALPLIKELREYTGLDLATAKYVVNEIEQNGKYEIPTNDRLETIIKEKKDELNKHTSFKILEPERPEEKMREALELANQDNDWRRVNIISEALVKMEQC